MTAPHAEEPSDFEPSPSTYEPPRARSAARSASSERPAPAHLPVANSEFEDEPAGAYLGELRVRGWMVAWALAGLVAASIGLTSWLQGPPVPEDSAWTLLKLLWAAAPVSASIVVLCVLWILSVQRGPSRRGYTALSLLFALVTVVVWFVGQQWVGVDFSAPPAPIEPVSSATASGPSLSAR